MDLSDLLGQTLDSKYKIERPLGRGGMGTVYLATHLGTERPVAVKVIAPQFMERAEFVEIEPISSCGRSPRRMIEPLPNFFSIFANADSIALPLSTDAIFVASPAILFSPFVSVFNQRQVKCSTKGVNCEILFQQ